jgi:hypothetical protein
MSAPKRQSAWVRAKLDPEMAERLQRACEFQQHDQAQLVRILIEWALPNYEKARSVEVLRKQRLASTPAKR